MKLYSFAPATNAQRVLMFVAEKEIDLPVVEVNVREGALFEPSYLAMNPFSVVPFLELDDGTCIGESVAICRYLEELYPNPPLCGVTAKDRALVEMWNRRIEIDGFMPVVHALRNVSPGFKGRVVSVETRDFFRPREESPSGQGYHWNGNAETYCLIGEAMAKALLKVPVAK